jgi:hypothetical protein
MGMRRGRTAFAIVATLLIGGAVAPGEAAAATGDQGVMVSAITVAADYATSHTAYAAASRLGCPSDCGVLLRTGDGGHTWVQVTARGWSGQPVFASTAAGAVTAAAQHVATSSDGGTSFVDTTVASGTLDVVGTGGGSLAALVSAGSDRYLLRLPSRQVSPLPAATLDRPISVFNPAYPHIAPGGVAALLAGNDPASGVPVVQRCDASFACTGHAPVGADKDVARLYVSPRVDGDGLVLAATSKNFFRSTDGGRSFAPLTVRPPLPNTLITTVQGVSFTPDFDAARHTGRVYLALISVTGTSGHPGSTNGGVYASADGASWSKLGGPSKLDAGAAAVAAAPDGRVLAAWVGVFSTGTDGGLVCTTDGVAWASTCPGGGGAGAQGSGSAASGGGQATPRGAVSSPGAATAAPATPAGQVPQSARDAGSTGAAAVAAHPSGSRWQSPLGIVAAVVAALLLGVAGLRRRRAGRRSA